MREQRRLLRQEDRDRRRQERKEADRNTVLLAGDQSRKEKSSNMAESKRTSQPQFYQIKTGEEFRSFNDMARKQKLQKYVLRYILNSPHYCRAFIRPDLSNYSFSSSCLVLVNKC